MRPRDWFSVGVRLLGVWILSDRGIGYLLAFGAIRLNLSSKSSFADGFDASRGADSYYLWYAVGECLLAAYFIFGAEHLTKWAFKERAQPEDDDNPSDSTGSQDK